MNNRKKQTGLRARFRKLLDPSRAAWPRRAKTKRMPDGKHRITINFGARSFFYALVPHEELANAKLVLDIEKYGRIEAPLAEVWQVGRKAQSLPLTVRLDLQREDQLPDYPAPLGTASAALAAQVRSVRRFPAYQLRAVSASGKVWRGPIVYPKAHAPAKKTIPVWSDLAGREVAAEVFADAIPDIKYVFDPRHGAWLRNAWEAGYDAQLGGGGRYGEPMNRADAFKRLPPDFARPDPVGTVWGDTDSLVLADADFLDVPDTATRCYQWTFHSGSRNEDEWQSRNRLNRTERTPGGRYDSCLQRDGFGHGVKHLADGAHNFAAHPEWFTAAKDGTRSAKNPNLCFLAYDMIPTYVSNLCAHIEKGYPGLRKNQVRIDYFNLSCDDSWQVCQCAKCTAPFVCENRKQLAPSDPAFRSSQYYTWLNKVARAVRKVYPNVTLGTYAYFFTLEPPPFPLESNILIEFCPYGVDDKKCITDDATNADLHRLAEGWGAASANTYCRSYWGWGQEFPRPVEYAMSSNVAYFASLRHPFRHYSCEFPIDKDWPDCRNAVATWDVSAMSAWIVTRLWWNSKADVGKLRADYCRRAYREGAAEMLAYYDKVRDAFFSDDIPSYYTGFSPIPYASRYILSKGLEKPLRGHLAAALDKARHPHSQELIRRHLARFDAWMDQARNRKTITIKVPYSSEKDLAGSFDAKVWEKVPATGDGCPERGKLTLTSSNMHSKLVIAVKLS